MHAFHCGKQRALFGVCERGYGVIPLQITNNVFRSLVAKHYQLQCFISCSDQNLDAGEGLETMLTLLSLSISLNKALPCVREYYSFIVYVGIIAQVRPK